MAQPEQNITLLKAKLAASRARLDEAAHHVTAPLDVPARVRREVSAHPLKWAAVALLGGAVAAKVVVPVALKVLGRSTSQKLTRTLLATLAPAAVRLGAQALSTRFPSLVTREKPESPHPLEEPPSH